jgi:hypothetical protein
MSGACFRLLLALGLTGVVTLAPAQTKKAPPTKFAVPGSPDSMSMGSKDGHPLRGHRAPGAKTRAEAAVATFPGFRLLPDGRSRIYVELTRSVSVDERRAEGMLIFVIHDARVPVRNNRNALITTHFATPVGRARLLKAGSDVELLIDLRKSVSATQKVVAGENGGARLEVDFPAGDYPPVPGLFEPPAGKGGSREAEEPEAGETAPAQGRAPSSAPGSGARGVALPADAPRVAPSGTPTSTPPAR